MALPIRGYERHLIRTDAEWVADDAVIPLGWTAFGHTGTTLTKVAFGNGDDAYSALDNILAGGPGGATAWGDITGTLSAQTDLQSALDAKANASTSMTHPQVLARTLGA